MTHPAFTREKTLLEQVQGLERIADEYRKSSGAEVADDILLTTLVKLRLPRQLKTTCAIEHDRDFNVRGDQGEGRSV